MNEPMKARTTIIIIIEQLPSLILNARDYKSWNCYNPNQFPFRIRCMYVWLLYLILAHIQARRHSCILEINLSTSLRYSYVCTRGNGVYTVSIQYISPSTGHHQRHSFIDKTRRYIFHAYCLLL